MFSSSLNLIFEPICAGDFLLFVFLTLSTPGRTVIIGLRPPLGAQLLFNNSNDFAEHEKKKAQFWDFVSLLDVGYLQEVFISVLS